MLWLHGCEARLSLPASLLSPGPVSDHLPTPGSGSGESFEAQHRSVLHSVTPGPLLTPETPCGSELLLRNAITLGKLIWVTIRRKQSNNSRWNFIDIFPGLSLKLVMDTKKFVFTCLCLLVKTGDKHWLRGEIDNPVSERRDTESVTRRDQDKGSCLREVSQNILILPEPGGVTRLIRCDIVTRNTLHVGSLAGLDCDSSSSSSCSPPWCYSAWSSNWPCHNTKWSEWIPSDTCHTHYTCTQWPRVTGTPWRSRVLSVQRYEHLNRNDLRKFKFCLIFLPSYPPGRWNYPYLTNIGNFSQNIS